MLELSIYVCNKVKKVIKDREIRIGTFLKLNNQLYIVLGLYDTQNVKLAMYSLTDAMVIIVGLDYVDNYKIVTSKELTTEDIKCLHYYSISESKALEMINKSDRALGYFVLHNPNIVYDKYYKQHYYAIMETVIFRESQKSGLLFSYYGGVRYELIVKTQPLVVYCFQYKRDNYEDIPTINEIGMIMKNDANLNNHIEYKDMIKEYSQSTRFLKQYTEQEMGTLMLKLEMLGVRI